MFTMPVSDETKILFNCLHIIDELMESESSGSEDEDLVIMFAVTRKRIHKAIKSNFVQMIDQFDDGTFRQNFRLDRGTFKFLLEEIKDALKNRSGFGRKQKEPKLQLLVTLWFFANPDSYR